MRTTARVSRVNALNSIWGTAVTGTSGKLDSRACKAAGFASNASRATTISSTPQLGCNRCQDLREARYTRTYRQIDSIHAEGHRKPCVGHGQSVGVPHFSYDHRQLMVQHPAQLHCVLPQVERNEPSTQSVSHRTLDPWLIGLLVAQCFRRSKLRRLPGRNKRHQQRGDHGQDQDSDDQRPGNHQAHASLDKRVAGKEITREQKSQNRSGEASPAAR